MNTTKTSLIVKPDYLDTAKRVFQDTGISVTSEDKRHLGASVGSWTFTTEYVNEKVQSWTTCLERLSDIAKVHPHMAYCTYVHGLVNKLTYFLWTIPDISDLLQPLETAIFHRFIPALVGKPVSDVECALLASPVRLGGLGVSLTLGQLLILSLLRPSRLLAHW